jgi:proteasome assembly chaperone (PAC2) family protein
MSKVPGPVAIAAFAGWNDAGSAATDTITYLASALHALPIASIDPEGFCDFQVNRPQARFDAQGERQIIWPSTDFMFGVTDNDTEVILVGGVEPSFHWRTYCDEILEILEDNDVNTLITVGALLADVPHSRPIPVHTTSIDPRVRRKLGIEQSHYEGPAGIVSVLEHAAWQRSGMPSLSLWAAVPHYVANPPSPKAQMALIHKIEEYLDHPIDITDLTDQARAWQEGVDTLAGEDTEIAEYVASLEAAKDALDSPASSGEALAKEFERYLQRRGED